MPAALPRPVAHPPRSLATIAPGETLVIRCILFDGIRAHCAALGLRAGTAVRCRDRSPTRLALETADGDLAYLERAWAAFVETDAPATERQEARVA